QDQCRDDDADRGRPAVERQRVVEHAGVAANDGMFQAPKQATPAAYLDLGGEPNTCHALLGDVEATVYRDDRLGHVVAVDLAETIRVKVFEVDGLGQSDVAVLLASLHQLTRV